MILKIFTSKKEHIDTPKCADQIKARLDLLASDYALGKMTQKEYKELCQTVNDGALAEANKRLEKLEETVNEQNRNDW